MSLLPPSVILPTCKLEACGTVTLLLLSIITPLLANVPVAVEYLAIALVVEDIFAPVALVAEEALPFNAPLKVLAVTEPLVIVNALVLGL